MTDASERIKDLEKAIGAVHARISKNSEYQMREWRLTAEDIKDSLMVHTEKIEGRVSSLESSREFARGAIKTLSVGVPVVGSISWFLFELWKSFRHKG